MLLYALYLCCIIFNICYLFIAVVVYLIRGLIYISVLANRILEGLTDSTFNTFYMVSIKDVVTIHRL